jgi:hypothetical protein
VIVGYRTREHPKREEKGAEYFRPFNYDIATRGVSTIESPEKYSSSYMWDWKLVKVAHFEPSVAPNVLFTYRTCWECESERMLSAFSYDSVLHRWKFRQWGSGKSPWWTTQIGIVVGADVHFWDDTVSHDCLWGVLDIDGDGLDDLAARCKEVHKPTKNKIKVDDSTILYGLKNGHFKGEAVTDKEQRRRIWDELCSRDTQNKLCRTE